MRLTLRDGEWEEESMDKNSAFNEQTHETSDVTRMLENLPCAVFAVDTEQRITYWNREAAALTGFAPEEVLGKQCTVFAMEPCSNGCAVFEGTCETPIQDRACSIRCKDGRTRIISKNADVLTDDTGNTVGVLESFFDITEQKRNEQNARRRSEHLEALVEERTAELEAARNRAEESEERLSLALAGASDGLWDWDLVGETIFLSPRWKSMLGYEDHEIENRVDTFFGLFHPEDVSGAREAITALMASNKDTFRAEVRLRHKAGHWVDILSRGTIVRDPETERPLRLVGTHVDLTELKKTQRDRYILQQLVENANFGIGSGTLDGRVTYLNPALQKMLGVESLETALGQPIVPFYPERIREKVATEVIPTVMEQGRWTGESVLLATDGSETPILENFFLVRDEEGQPICLGDVMVDISELKAVEEEHRRSREQLKSIFENAPLGIALVDSDGKPVVNNPALQEILGYGEDELRSKSFIEFTHPEDADKDLSLYQELIKGQRNRYAIEKRYIRKDGEMIWGDLTVASVRDADGSVSFAVGMVEDVTDRKTIEDALTRERDFSNALLDALPGVFYVLDTEGRFRRWNDNFSTVTGYSHEELGTMSALELFDGADRTLIAERIGRVFEEGVSFAEADFVTKDGERKPHYFTGVMVVMNGEPRLVGVGIDITEQKRANEELATIFEMSLNPVCIADLETATFTRVNPAFETVLGYTPEELLGRPFLELIHPDDVAPTLAVNEEKLKAGEKVIHFENRYRAKDGSYRWLDWVSNPVPERGVTYATAYDVTERRETEERLKALMRDLQRSNKDLEQFAYVASHDLQEPLRMVGSYTQLLARRYEGQLDEKADKYIGYAVDGAKRMQRLIEDLLTFSRVGTRGGKPEPTDSGEVVDGVLKNLNKHISDNSAEVIVGDLPKVMADPTQLGQVFQNLIANAIKFKGDAPPKIEISAARQDDMWEFTVADNGIGIDPQFFDRIFIIFQRLHKRDEHSGSGIGLSIVKKIVERHGGRIHIESEPGKGACFIFTMPAVSERSREDIP